MKNINIAIYMNVWSKEILTIHSEGELYSSKNKKKITCTLHKHWGESKEIPIKDSAPLLKEMGWKQISPNATINVEE